MIETAPPSRLRPLGLLLAVLPAVLAIFPPEVHGESLAGAAALVALAAILACREPASPYGGAAGIALLASAPAAVIVARAASAPGAAVEPLAILVAAFGLAAAAASLPEGAVRERGIPASVAIAGVLVSARALHETFLGLPALERFLAAGAAVPDRALLLARVREGRPYAGFPTPAALGGFLAAALAVTAGLALAVRDRRWRALLWAGAAIELAGLLATRSLTSAGALLVATLLAFAARWTGSRRRVARIALAVLAVAVVGVAAIRGRGAIDPSQAASPWRLRAGNARVAAEMIRDHPWLGVGPGGYGECYPAYRRPDDNESRHAHSLPLDLAAEYGILPGAVLVGLLLGGLWGPLLRSGPKRGPAALGAATGLAALGVQSLADFTLLLPSILGIAAVLRATAAPASPAGVPGEDGARRWGACAAVVAACVVLGLGGLAANLELAAREAAVTGDRLAAAASAARAAVLAPWDPDAVLLDLQAGLEARSSPAAQEAELRHAEEAADRAVALSPVRAATRELRSRIRAARGDRGGAYADLAEAARLYPLRREYAERRDAAAAALRENARGGGGER